MQHFIDKDIKAGGRYLSKTEGYSNKKIIDNIFAFLDIKLNLTCMLINVYKYSNLNVIILDLFQII